MGTIPSDAVRCTTRSHNVEYHRKGTAIAADCSGGGGGAPSAVGVTAAPSSVSTGRSLNADPSAVTYEGSRVRTESGSFRTATTSAGVPAIVFERNDGDSTTLYAIENYDGVPTVGYDLNGSTVGPEHTDVDELSGVIVDEDTGRLLVETQLVTGHLNGYAMAPEEFAKVQMSDIWWLDEEPEERERMLANLGVPWPGDDEDASPGDGVPHPGAVAIAELAATPEGEAWLREHAAPRKVTRDLRYSNPHTNY